MSKFQFKAKTFDGKVVNGEVEAENVNEARVKLRTQRLIPTRISNKDEKTFGKNRGGNITFGSPKVKPKELQVFTRQFSVLISSGIPIVQSLQALSEGSAIQGELIRVIKALTNSVEKGKRLAEAMLDHPKVFDRTYVNLVKAGEEGGVLDTILDRLAGQIERNHAIASKVKGALTYPVVILLVSLAVIAIIMVFVIPSFVEVFKNAGNELPLITQYVILVSDFFVDWYIVIIPSLIVAPILVIQYYGTSEGRKVCDSFIIGAPIFGDIVQKSAIAKFSRTLSTLLASGVRIVDCLEISAATSGNWVIESAVIKSKESINKGRSMVEPLIKEKYVPEMVTQMMKIGEQTGNVDVMLGKVADFYEEEVETAADTLTSLIEPMLMVGLGGIIAILVTAMYLPIFTMAGAAG